MKYELGTARERRRNARSPSLQRTKARGEFKEILLAPLFKGMVMAASTLNPQPEEKLSGVFHLGGRIFHFPVPGRRRISNRVAGRRQNLAHELVVGFIRQQAMPDPIMESKRG